MKKILTVSALTLLITACGGPNMPNAVTSVSGTVVEMVPPAPTATEYTLTTKAWTGGAGTVNGQMDSSVTKIKLGDLAASGAFTATLPAPADADLAVGGNINVDPSCTGQYQVSEPAARIGMLGVTVDVADATKDGTIAPVAATIKDTTNSAGTGVLSLNVQAGFLMYADRAVNVSGSQTCNRTSGGFTYPETVKFDLNLVKGWNRVTFKDEGSITYTNEAVTAAQETLSITSGSLPSDKWLWGGTAIVGMNAGKGLNVATTPAALLDKAQGLLR